VCRYVRCAETDAFVYAFRQRTIARWGLRDEDLRTFAYEALLDGVERFENEPHRFRAFLAQRIRWRIADGLRLGESACLACSYRRHGRRLPVYGSLDQVAFVDNESGDAVTYLELLPATEVLPRDDGDEGFEALLALVDRPVDRTILDLYFRHGLTMRAIGFAVGISESRVSQRVSAALFRLRAILEAREGSGRCLSRAVLSG